MSRQTCLDPVYYHGIPVFPMSQFNFLPEAMSLRNILRNLSPDFSLGHSYFWQNPISGKLESLRMYTDAKTDATKYELGVIEGNEPSGFGWQFTLLDYFQKTDN